MTVRRFDLENKERSFVGQAYMSFIRIHGWLLGLVALAITIGLLFWQPEAKIAVKWFVLLFAPMLILLITFLDLAYQSFNKNIFPLPKVIASKGAPSVYKNAKAILLLEPSIIFAHESFVSIYLKESSFEKLIAVGHVATIQEEGRIQVVITQLIDIVDSDWLSLIIANNADIHKNILVKPTFPKFIAELGGF